MRTTIRLADELLAEARRVALESGTTLTVVIEDALRERLARRRAGSHPEPVSLTTVGGKGLQPGVDLDDSAALRDVMDAAP